MARASIPKITWGAGFVNTLTFGQPLDSAVSYPLPREGSEWAQGSSGERDAWLQGDDQRLQGVVRNIPTADSADPVATGWDGVAGWAAFLSWARAMNPFRWYPDRDLAAFHTCYLVEPLQGAPTQEENGDRQLAIEIEDTSGTAFTGY